MEVFPPFLTDFYKTGHVFQYPKGTSLIYSNITARSDKHANVLPDFDHKVVFVGLLGVCKWLLIDLWNKYFFQKPKEEVVAKYQDRMDKSLGKGAVSSEHIAALHDLGYLPIKIKALREGSRVDIRVPLFTIVNTIPEFYWVTNYLETQISAETWKTINSATIAYEFRRLFERYAKQTGAAPEFVDFQGHDFSMRGMSGIYDATQSGIGHLSSFLGTDTISAIDYIENYYSGEEPLGFSVPATEHSVACTYASLSETSDVVCSTEAGELEYFRALIEDIYPKGIVSIVSDTFDFFKVITEFTVKLKEKIVFREGKVVFRPDSGNPIKIICGDPDATPGTPEYKGAVECLWEIFGGVTNSLGYKELDPHVGLIYGDSITLTIAFSILSQLEAKGFCTNCIVFGIGSFTYQCTTRDALGLAMKATYAVVDGNGRELFKDPKTDSGMKKSAKGLLRVELEDTKINDKLVNRRFVLLDRQTPEGEKLGILETIFEDSRIIRNQTWKEIRKGLKDPSSLY